MNRKRNAADNAGANQGGTAMLAGIFMLRLEAAARAAPKATEVLRCRELTGCAISRQSAE